MTSDVIYKVSVSTSDLKGAGTNAKVFIILFGKKNDTGKLFLKKSSTNKDPFEKGKTDVFELHAADIGKDLTQIRLGHDNSGLASGWHCREVIVETPRKKYVFPCDKWFDKKEDDGKIERDLFPEDADEGSKRRSGSSRAATEATYKITVVTSDIKGAGTNSKMFIQLFSRDGDTGEISLKKSLTNKDPFEKGKTDVFEVRTLNIGDDIDQIRLGHDNSGLAAGWHCKEVTVETQSGRKFRFPCNKWFDKKEDDHKIERVLAAEKEHQDSRDKKPKHDSGDPNKNLYKIYVRTSNFDAASTNANVFLQLYGTSAGPLPNTSKRRRRSKSPRREIVALQKFPLEKCVNNARPFQKGAVDVFHVELDAPVGELHRVRVSHNGAGIGAGWHLKSIRIKEAASKRKWRFKCGKWLDRFEDDGKTERDLDLHVSSNVPGEESPASSDEERYTKSGNEEAERILANLPRIAYTVKTRTSDFSAKTMTDSIALKIVGVQAPIETSIVKLNSERSDKGKDQFTQGSYDFFKLEDIDVGVIKKVQLLCTHGDELKTTEWFFDELVVDVPSKLTRYFFNRKSWSEKVEEPNLTILELYPITIRNVKKSQVYKVAVFVRKLHNKPEFLANLVLTLHGDYGSTTEATALRLPEAKATAARLLALNSTDVVHFHVNHLADIGELLKVNLKYKFTTHKNLANDANTWHLERVEVQHDKRKYLFPCDKRIAPSKKKPKRQIEIKLYEANYKTSRTVTTLYKEAKTKKEKEQKNQYDDSFEDERSGSDRSMSPDSRDRHRPSSRSSRGRDSRADIRHRHHSRYDDDYGLEGRHRERERDRERHSGRDKERDRRKKDASVDSYHTPSDDYESGNMSSRHHSHSPSGRMSDRHRERGRDETRHLDGRRREDSRHSDIPSDFEKFIKSDLKQNRQRDWNEDSMRQRRPVDEMRNKERRLNMKESLRDREAFSADPREHRFNFKREKEREKERDVRTNLERFDRLLKDEQPRDREYSFDDRRPLQRMGSAGGERRRF